MALPGSPSELADRTQRLIDELVAIRRDVLSVTASVDVAKGPMTAPNLLSVEVAAEYLMISRTMIYALIRSGELVVCLQNS